MVTAIASTYMGFRDKNYIPESFDCDVVNIVLHISSRLLWKSVVHLLCSNKFHFFSHLLQDPRPSLPVDVEIKIGW